MSVNNKMQSVHKHFEIYASASQIKEPGEHFDKWQISVDVLNVRATARIKSPVSMRFGDAYAVDAERGMRDAINRVVQAIEAGDPRLPS